MKPNVNIADYPEIIDEINAKLNNESIAEVKLEWNGKKQKNDIVVVDIRRKVGCRVEIK